MARRKQRKSQPVEPDRSKAVALVRVSTEQQQQSGLGLEDQERMIREWAGRHDIDIVAWHQETRSGGAPIAERTEMHAAIADVGVHGAGWLVVLRRDRLARDIEVTLFVERMLDERGAMIACADGSSTGTDDPAERFKGRMMALMGDYERDLISARTRAALRSRRERGLQPGGTAPFGYEWVGQRLWQHPREQRVLRRMRELRETGHSVREIARILNQSGQWACPRKGGQWSKTRVAEVVRRADEEATE